jgi:hypothetical protein
MDLGPLDVVRELAAFVGQSRRGGINRRRVERTPTTL